MLSTAGSKLTQMETVHKIRPRIAQGWLRALLFVIVWAAVVIIAGVFVVLALANAGSSGLTASNRVYAGLAASAFISFALVWLFRRFIDRRSFASLGFTGALGTRYGLTGFSLALFLLCTGVLVLTLTKSLEWTDAGLNVTDLFTGMVSMAMVAFYEELVFRGYLLGNLMESMNKWAALLISAVLFALAHLSNPHLSAPAVVNVLLAGLLLGINYIQTRNLWFSIAFHFAWNFVQGPVMGFDVSGLPLKSVLQHELHGNELWSGGAFGFEGSLVATILLVVSIVSLGWIYERKYSPKSEIVSRESIVAGIQSS